MTDPDATIAPITGADGEVAARDALLRRLAHDVDELCDAVAAADAAKVDPVARPCAVRVVAARAG